MGEMADTKDGREEQARNEEERQRERELAAAFERGDEDAPAAIDEDRDGDGPPTCHRRGCDDPAAFVVLERYQEETGHGVVEAQAALCRAHTREESPTNLDGAYDGYVFRVDPLPARED